MHTHAAHRFAGLWQDGLQQLRSSSHLRSHAHSHLINGCTQLLGQAEAEANKLERIRDSALY